MFNWSLQFIFKDFMDINQFEKEILYEKIVMMYINY